MKNETENLRKKTKRKNFAKKTKNLRKQHFFKTMEVTAKNLQELSNLIESVKMIQVRHIAAEWLEMFTCPDGCDGSLSTCSTVHIRFTKERLIDELQKAATLEVLAHDGLFLELLQLAYENKWECYPLVHSVLAHLGKYLWPEKWNRERLQQDPFHN
jgi:hypothetical protein